MKLCSVHVVPNKQISLSKIRSYLSLFINPHTVKNIMLQRHKSHQTVWPVLTTIFKLPSFHGLAPSYINELLIERNSSYNLRGKHSLSIPRVQSTKYGLHSFRYSASKYWNMLPEVLRSAQSLHVFKSKIKSISFDNKCCSFCN